MRIRKNAKLSPLLFSSMASVPEVLQTHVCQLNQSPWDVIPFGQDTSQLETEDSFTGNGSLGDSIGAVESVASMMEGSAKLSNNIVITNDNEVMADKDRNCEVLDENGIGFEKLVRKVISGDDHDWKSTKQAKEDYSLFSCDPRRSLLRSSDIAAGENNYYSTTPVTSNNCPITKKAVPPSSAGTAASRRTRPSRASKKAPAAAAAGGSNPYEFYYYSGFGPLWGKKRRDRGGVEDGGNCKIEGKSVENMNGIQSNTTTPSSSQIDNDEFDYVDEDDEEEEGDGDGGKKRMRKPVKARSLKSLM